MFLMRMFVPRFLYPVPLCLEILVTGLVLLSFTRWRKAGKAAVLLGVLLLAIFGNYPFSNLLVRPLEREYPPLVLTPDGRGGEEIAHVKFIVVLAGGFSSDPEIPSFDQIEEDTLARVVEGIRLYRDLPGRKLLVSGGRVLGGGSAGEGMSRTAQALGVPRQDIVLESESTNTEEEARLIAPRVGKDPFILVTSAWHMARSMALFKKRGTNPIAAPTDYLARHRAIQSPDIWVPSALGLRSIERAEHEYLGIIWARLRGQA